MRCWGSRNADSAAEMPNMPPSKASTPARAALFYLSSSAHSNKVLVSKLNAALSKPIPDMMYLDLAHE